MKLPEKYQGRLKDRISLAARDSHWRDFPSSLHPELIQFLKDEGIRRLYSHQSEMFELARQGKNLLITTATASGKTLAFLLPVVQKILEQPTSRAFFLYPTKALAHDQYRHLEPFLDYFGPERIQAGIYDGDTPPNERTRIRKEANIILTNPDMVNGSFLPNHSLRGFNSFFPKLKFVVLDELHVYRGAFGSHVSNLMRRLHRICRFYQSSPQFLFASATIANPVELAENIIHQPVKHIEEDGSPQAERELLIWQPPFVGDSPFRRRPEEDASEIIPKLVEERERFITFCKSRRSVEVVVKESRDRLSSLEDKPTLGRDLSDKISGYRGGYTREERKEIERRLVQGELLGVISTNVLELGIDLGELEIAILCGFPNTRASFWQQLGRVGRRGKKAYGILILDSGSQDQYIASNTDYLLNSGVEHAVIDKNNLFIQLAHVRAAAAEIPLSLEDAAHFPHLGEIIPVLMEASELKKEGTKFFWIGKEYPAGDFSLRNISRHVYKVINKETGEFITEMDESQAYHEVYPKAIYLHDAMPYKVESLDLKNRVARVYPVDFDYFTVPFVETEVRIIKSFKEEDYHFTATAFGDVLVRETIPAYKMIQFHTHQNLGYEPISLPLVQKLETEGFWIQVPPKVEEVYDSYGPYNFYRGLEHALLMAAMRKTMATREDLNATFFAGTEDKVPFKKAHILLYDLYPGGLGFAEKAFDYALEILEEAYLSVNRCACDNGCPACVGDYYLDRKMILWGLESFIRETAAPKNIDLPDRARPMALPPKTSREFTLKELPEKWDEFLEKLGKTGESLTQFLSQIKKLEVEENTLRFYLHSPFLCQWAMDDPNQRQLRHLISTYVEVPSKFHLEFKGTEGAEDTLDKLRRRYDDLG